MDSHHALYWASEYACICLVSLQAVQTPGKRRARTCGNRHSNSAPDHGMERWGALLHAQHFPLETWKSHNFFSLFALICVFHKIKITSLLCSQVHSFPSACILLPLCLSSPHQHHGCLSCALSLFPSPRLPLLSLFISSLLAKTKSSKGSSWLGEWQSWDSPVAHSHWGPLLQVHEWSGRDVPWGTEKLRKWQ